MKVAIGQIHHEANSFCVVPTQWDDFDFIFDDAVLTCRRGSGMMVGGMIDVLEAQPGIELVPLIAGVAPTGGTLVREGFDAIVESITTRLEQADVDAVVLDLHGAMLADGVDDPEGEILATIRGIVGPDVPVVIGLDCHGNITRKMVDNVDLLDGYRTYPHRDYRETGERVARLFVEHLHGLNTVRHLVRVPALFAAGSYETDEPPFRDVLDVLRGAEAAGIILAGSFYPVQPWLDIETHGCTIVVTAHPDQSEAAAAVACRTAQLLWDRREECHAEFTAPADAVRQACDMSGTIVISEGGDAVSGGGCGDSSLLLQALLPVSEVSSAITICDAPAVDAATAAGVGATITTSIGGSLAPQFSDPVRIDAEVVALGDGVWVNEGEVMRGFRNDMGGAAVLRCDNIHIVCSRKRVMSWDPGVFRCMGIEPTDMKIVGVKAQRTLETTYGDILSGVFWLDMPGACTANLTQLPWQRIRRPIWPLDRDIAYRATIEE